MGHRRYTSGISGTKGWLIKVYAAGGYWVWDAYRPGVQFPALPGTRSIHDKAFTRSGALRAARRAARREMGRYYKGVAMRERRSGVREEHPESGPPRADRREWGVVVLVFGLLIAWGVGIVWLAA